MKAFWKALCTAVAVCMLAASPAVAEEAESERPWLEEEKAEITVSDVEAALPVSEGTAKIYATEIAGEKWLFLPAFADVNTMALSQNGEALTWEQTDEADGVRIGSLFRDGETVDELRVMQSENLRALFLFSDDPVNQGRAYVDTITTKANRNKATGAISVVAVDGTVDYADDLRQIRTRGNLTWGLDKRAYQIKLENRADLLKTGDKAERNRTWVLLADHLDRTMLHNRIALDLAQEIGMTDSPRCEHVTVYYDGEYRGLYLLTEKVEVSEGRIDVDDYSKLVEKWNESAGQTDLDALEVKFSENRYGCQFTYVDGLAETDDPSVGTFVLEMEHEVNTLTETCWLKLGNGSILGVKSPEYASKQMMRYISERLEEARLSVVNGGTNPETGLTMEDYFDVEGFARILLFHEALSNIDGYGYSSSWFILPAGEIRFVPGPVWDFDLSMREFRTGVNAGARNVKNADDWPGMLYRVPRFVQKMQEIWTSELRTAIQDVLLGEKNGTTLRSLDEYVAQIEADYRMNDMIWDSEEYGSYVYGDTWEEDMEMLRTFLTNRCRWMDEVFMSVPAEEDAIHLSGYALYMKLGEEGAVTLTMAPWGHGTVQVTALEQLTEADEESYALWRLEALITPDEGHVYEEPEVWLGEDRIGYEKQADGTLRIAFAFEDLSYRPVDYYGEDIGMVYNPDVYAANYPEIAEMYEDDPEGLMDYFCDEGMYEDQMGNAFFRPSEVLYTFPNLYDLLGTDWSTYYWDFIYYGYSDGWLRRLSYGYPLTVAQSEF